MTKTKMLQNGFVHPGSPHILISFSHEYDGDWQSVALLSCTDSVDELRLCLLQELDDDILRLIHRELDFYLFRKGESDPVAYLQYHANTLANIYSNFQFSYNEGISIDGLGYYSRIQGMIKNKDLEYTKNCLCDAYLHTIMLNLQDMATFTDESSFKNYFNLENLPILHKSIFKKLPKQDGFLFTSMPYIKEFAKQWGMLGIDEMCYFLSYLYVCGFMTGPKVVKAMRLHHLLTR